MSPPPSHAPVDPSNDAQRGAWDGDAGAFWADQADRFDRTIAAYDDDLHTAAAVEPADRVLDVGCGTGHTARRAARAAPTGSVLGVDLSAAMLDVARRRATEEGITNVAFLQADAQVHPFERGAFDVVVSRTGTMFFGRPDVAFANLAGALRPGGRIVLLAWQAAERNEWIRELSGALSAGRDRSGPPPGAPGPFALADADRVRALLSGAGFTHVDVEARSARMWFGADVDDAERFVGGLLGWMLDGLDEEGRADARRALRCSLAAHADGDAVRYGSATWIVRAVRS